MSALWKHKRTFRKLLYLFDTFKRVPLIKINKSKLLFYKYYNKYNARLLILTDKNCPKLAMIYFS